MEQQDIVRPKSYVFTGRINPERYEWGINPPYGVVQTHSDGSSTLMQVSIQASQVSVTVQTNSDDPVIDMKNRVTSQARSLADALGYVCGAALDVEIIACVDSDGNRHVFNTAFHDLHLSPIGSGESLKIFNVLIGQAGRSQFVRMALADLRSAILEPFDTCVNCYRAVESIRHEYLEGELDSGAARKNSWKRLRDALAVKEEDLRWLEERATPRRHGRALDVTHSERERALRLARHVVEAYCLAHQELPEPDTNSTSRPLNDVQAENKESTSDS
jgi:hypothetical protein